MTSCCGLLAATEAESYMSLPHWLPDRIQRDLEIGAVMQECNISFHALLMSSLGTCASTNVRNECNKPLSWYPERWRWGNSETVAWICLLLDTAEHLAALVMRYINRQSKQCSVCVFGWGGVTDEKRMTSKTSRANREPQGKITEQHWEAESSTDMSGWSGASQRERDETDSSAKMSMCILKSVCL